jgi:hypothetical protein
MLLRGYILEIYTIFSLYILDTRDGTIRSGFVPAFFSHFSHRCGVVELLPLWLIELMKTSRDRPFRSTNTPQLRLEGNSPPELPGLAVVLSGKQLKISFYVEFSTCKTNWILPS